jgi:tetratricopeptide (TPR) repeat protein
MAWARKDFSEKEKLALAMHPPVELMVDFKLTKNPAFQNAIFDRIVSMDTSVRTSFGGKKVKIDYKLPYIELMLDFALEEELAVKCARYLCTQQVPVSSLENIAARTKFNPVAEEVFNTILKSDAIKLKEKFEILGGIGKSTKNLETVKRALQLMDQSEAPEECKIKGIGRIRAVASFEPKSVQRSAMEELKIPFPDYGDFTELKEYADSIAKAGRFEWAFNEYDRAMDVLKKALVERVESKTSQDERNSLTVRLASVLEAGGEMLFKLDRKTDAANAYFLAAHQFHGLDVKSELRNLDRVYDAVKGSEGKNELEKFTGIINEPNQLERVKLAKKHLSDFLDAMVKNGEIKKTQKAGIHRLLVEENILSEEVLSLAARNKEFKEDGMHLKEGYISELDVSGGKVRWGDQRMSTAIPNASTIRLAYDIFEKGIGDISGFTSFKIALEQTKTFTATLLNVGDKIVESELIPVHYDPARARVGSNKLWS